MHGVPKPLSYIKMDFSDKSRTRWHILYCYKKHGYSIDYCTWQLLVPTQLQQNKDKRQYRGNSGHKISQSPPLLCKMYSQRSREDEIYFFKDARIVRPIWLASYHDSVCLVCGHNGSFSPSSLSCSPPCYWNIGPRAAVSHAWRRVDGIGSY